MTASPATTATTPAAHTPAVRSSKVVSCDPFDPQTEPWDLFIERFDFFLIGNRLTDLTDKEKQGLFLNCCGKHVHQVARSIATPKTMHQVDWTELRDGLQQHFAPKPSILSRRITFFERKQREGESFTNYLANLRILAGDCEFGPELEDSIRDKLVWGLRDEKLKRRLVGRPSCSLATAIEEAMSAETSNPTTKRQTAEIVYQTTYDEEEDDDLAQNGDVLQVRPTRGPKMAAAPKPRQNPCVGCNGNHPRSSCPFLQSICSYCYKKGHIFRACRAVPPNQQQPGPSTRGQRPPPFRRGMAGPERWANNPRKAYDECLTIYADIQQTSTDGTDAEEFSTSVSIGGKTCTFQIDSGSPVTIMSWRALQDLIPTVRRGDLTSTKTILRDCQGGPIPLMGKLDVHVQHDKFAEYLPLIITKGEIPKLLGRHWFRQLKLTLGESAPRRVNNTSAAGPKEDIFEEFADVFNGELGKYKGTPIALNLDPATPPIRLKPRRVPLALKHKVDEQLDKLIAQGILVPVDHARWETPIVTPLKPDGTLRICADYKCSVNKALQWNPYPVPVVQHLLHSLGQGKIFAKLDLAQAYQQLPVSKETAEAQTIVTHRGAFNCTRLQFGISTAPGIFQSLMERLLQGIPGVTPYFDDVLVAAMDRRDLTAKLRTTLQRFRESGLKLNKQKCSIGVPAVEFLGFKIDAAGIHPTDSKTAAIHRAPPPSNKTQLQAFLGLLNFYSIFLRNKATIAEPLHKLLGKDAPWRWGAEEQKAFQDIKKLLTSNSVLVQYNESRPLQLTCDASPYGVGAVLSHVFPDGHSAPIAFYSRTLSTPERNYSQLDKEALAAIAGVKRFHDYLYGRKFTLVTDHKPLLGIIAGDKQTPQILSPRMTRWLEFLAAYSYHLEYHPGTQIAHADALSRCPVPDCPADPAPSIPLLLIEHVQEQPITADEIANHTAKDPTLKTVLHWVLNGWPHDKRGEQFKHFESRQTELSTQRGCLMWGHRVVIPPTLRNTILTTLHEGHLGIARMKALARSYIWWPELDKDIEGRTQSCQPCQQSHAAPPRAPPSKWEPTQNPWSRIHIDFAGPVQQQMLLIIVDSHSNWTEVIPMRSATTDSTITALQKLFATHGLPDVVVSDNGPQFTATEFNTFLQNLGIRHTTSAPFRPMANGRAERAVRTTKDTLARMNSGNLQQKINTFLLAQHSTPSPTSHRSPAELLMGRKIKIPLSRVHPDASPPIDPVLDPNVRTLARGEGVFARNYASGTKWLPGIITRPTGPKSYELELEDGRIWKRHIDQLRKRNKDLRADQGEEEDPPDTTDHTTADEDTHFLPEGRSSLSTAAEAQQPPSPSPPPPPQTPPRTEEVPGTSFPGGSSGSNERSLRRSARARHRPTYLRDYACAIRHLETSRARGEGCNVLRRRERSFHSGPPA